MAGVVEGRYQTDENVEVILDRMVGWATEYFGQSLTEDELSAIRSFYRPIARQHLLIQQQIGIVLNSAQIDYAEGQALDYLCALLNIVRQEAETATGEVVFSRSNKASNDYSIPAGTAVQTNGADPIRFETTKQKSLLSGNTSVTVPVEAVEGGLSGNVAADTIVTFETKPSGIETVTNPEATDGGTVRETDDELRERAKEQVADGSGATARSLISSVSNIDEDVRSVSIQINDTSIDNTPGGLPDHSFELIVEAPELLHGEIAQTIMDTKAAGDNSYAGVHGTEVIEEVELETGQKRDVSFSVPTEVPIQIEADLEVNDSYPGDGKLIDNIVSYIGGTDFEGKPTAGSLRQGEDIVYGEVEFAIREIEGVYDVTTLKVGKVGNTLSTSNIQIDTGNIAILNGNESTPIDITTTEV
jgi:uncharacterized phage protein gp47/JayE